MKSIEKNTKRLLALKVGGNNCIESGQLGSRG
jgi:hypothetical protein